MRTGTSVDSKRSIGQLRRVVKYWRLRAAFGIGLVLLSAIGLSACGHFSLNWFWRFLCITGIVSGLIEIFSDINAWHDTKTRIRTIENAPDETSSAGKND